MEKINSIQDVTPEMIREMGLMFLDEMGLARLKESVRCGYFNHPYRAEKFYFESFTDVNKEILWKADFFGGTIVDILFLKSVVFGRMRPDSYKKWVKRRIHINEKKAEAVEKDIQKVREINQKLRERNKQLNEELKELRKERQDIEQQKKKINKIFEMLDHAAETIEKTTDELKSYANEYE